MWRYLLAATAIVGAVATIVMALPGGSGAQRASRYASVAGATPGPPEHDVSRAVALPVTGDAPWALSALPGCFTERDHRSGRPAFARVLLAGARPLTAPLVLRAADCTLAIRGDSATVARAADRLTVPRPTRFYTRGRDLIVERRDGPRDDVRVYAVRAPRP